jgi:DNA-binding transcriptional MocR family regulator
MWTPDLSGRRGPLATALADAIAEGVQTGRLAPGDRLPPQRDLADAIGLSVTTVTRGYAEAERRGLVTGEVGRGTFVRPPAFGAMVRADEPRAIDLSVNTLLPFAHAAELVAGYAALSRRLPADRLMGYQPHHGRAEWRAAAAEWVKAAGLSPAPEEMLVTAGAQHALAVVFAVICGPGDEVLTEPATYPGMKSVASYLRLRLRAVAVDREGVLPDALERAVASGRPRALYCMPTLQNPTGAVASLRRRRALAETAARLGLTVVEDDSYGFLVEGLPSVTSLAPDHSIYVTSMSKSLAPGFRLGFIRAPRAWVDRLGAAIFATTIMAAPAGAEVAAAWIADGTAARIVRWKRAEVAARSALARRRLKLGPPPGGAASPHVWLPLPEDWTADEYAREARRRGVLVTPGREFATGREIPNAIRICLGVPPDRRTLERGLRTLEALAREPTRAFSTVV